MKIIDKNKDFYDYMQGIYFDDSNTFDRRGSHIITKEMLLEPFGNLETEIYYLHIQINYLNYIIKAVGNDFSYGCKGQVYSAKDLTFKLVTLWKSYKTENLIKLDFFQVPKYNEKHFESDPVSFLKETKTYQIHSNQCHWNGFDINEKNFPIFKESGLVKFFDAQEVYFAIDNWFSGQKTKNERTESNNITDKEKIINHGFDTIYSFRNKK